MAHSAYKCYAGTTSLKNMRALIVEDEPLLANIYSSLLEKEGCSVCVEHDGEQALYRMRADPPDIILLDLCLPKKNGIAVLKEKKEDKSIAPIPVLILSGIEDQKMIDEAKALGATDYCHKLEVEVEPLLKKIRKIVPDQ